MTLPSWQYLIGFTSKHDCLQFRYVAIACYPIVFCVTIYPGSRVVNLYRANGINKTFSLHFKNEIWQGYVKNNITSMPWKQKQQLDATHGSDARRLHWNFCLLFFGCRFVVCSFSLVIYFLLLASLDIIHQPTFFLPFIKSSKVIKKNFCTFNGTIQNIIKSTKRKHKWGTRTNTARQI